MTSINNNISLINMPISDKIGTLRRTTDSKYSSWSIEPGYYQRPSTAIRPPPLFKTDSRINSESISKESLILNRTLMTNELNRNKNSINFEGSSILAPEELRQRSIKKKTNLAESFLNFQQLYSFLHSTVTQEYLQTKFFKYLKPNPNIYDRSRRPKSSWASTATWVMKTIEGPGKEVISEFDLTYLLADIFCGHAPDFFVYSMKEILAEKSIQNEININDFLEAFECVREIFYSEVTVRSEEPPLITLMKKPREHDKNLHYLMSNLSTYQETFSKQTALTLEESHKPNEERFIASGVKLSRPSTVGSISSSSSLTIHKRTK